jgi:hypothetical protein
MEADPGLMTRRGCLRTRRSLDDCWAYEARQSLFRALGGGCVRSVEICAS